MILTVSKPDIRLQLLFFSHPGSQLQLLHCVNRPLHNILVALLVDFALDVIVSVFQCIPVTENAAHFLLPMDHFLCISRQVTLQSQFLLVLAPNRNLTFVLLEC